MQKPDSYSVAKPISISRLGVVQICSWGSLFYSFPQIAAAIGGEFAWAKSETYMALSIALLVSAAASIPIGAWIDRGYARSVMMWGTLIGSVLLVGLSQVESLALFYWVYAGIGLAYSATLYDAAFSAVANHTNPSDTRRSITLLTLWGGMAGTIAIPLIEVLLQNFHWTTVVAVIGVFNLTFSGYFLRTLPPAPERHPTATPRPSLIHSEVLSEVFRTLIFWVLLTCFCLFAAVSSAFIFHLYPLLIERGIVPETVVLCIAVVGPAQIVGRFCLSLIPSRLPIARIGMGCALLFFTVFWLLYSQRVGVAGLVFALVIFGVVCGVMTIIKGIAVPELISKTHYGSIYAAMSVPEKVALAMAPSLAAVVWNLGANYSLLLLLLAIASGLLFVSFAVLLRVEKTSNRDPL